VKKILDITPMYSGYEDYEKDSDGKYILPCNEAGYIRIYRKNTVNYGNGLIGLADGSKISHSDWTKIRKGFVLVENDGTEKQFFSVGGSDTGAIMGVSKYSNALDIYNTKKSLNEKEIDPKTEYTFEYGHRNEELIAMGFQQLTNMDVVKDNTIYFREDTGFMQANIDFYVRHPDGEFSVLEIKTINSNNNEAIADYKNGIVPLYYYSQAVLHYPMTVGVSLKIKGTFFAVGYNNSLNNIIICHFNRDFKQEKMLFVKEKEFVDCLRFDVMPIVKNKKVYPVADKKSVKINEKSISAAKDILEINKKISELKTQIKILEKQVDNDKNIIIDNIADAEISKEFSLDGTDYYVSYKNSRRENVNKNILVNKYPEIADEVISCSNSRVFKINEVKKK